MTIPTNREIHELTLAEFLGQAPIRTDIYVSGAETCSYTLKDLNLATAVSSMDILGTDLPSAEDYFFCRQKKNATNMIAAYEDADGIWTAVGDFTGENLFLEPGHRGKGVGSLLVLTAAAARGGEPMPANIHMKDGKHIAERIGSPSKARSRPAKLCQVAYS